MASTLCILGVNLNREKYYHSLHLLFFLIILQSHFQISFKDGRLPQVLQLPRPLPPSPFPGASRPHLIIQQLIYLIQYLHNKKKVDLQGEIRGKVDKCECRIEDACGRVWAFWSEYRSRWTVDFVMIMSQEGAGWTNTVLVERQAERQFYYLPCYLRIKIKNFLSLSLSKQEAEINADLLFAVHFGALPTFVLQELGQAITLQFNRNDAITLAKSIEISILRSDSAKTLSFTVRKNLKCGIDCNFFWAPFEVIYLSLVITIRSLQLAHPITGAPITLRFNLMDHPLRHAKVSLTREDSFGNYKLAPRKIRVYYSRQLYYDPFESNREDEESNQLISLQNQLHESVEILHQAHQVAREDKLAYYQYAHFVIPMYRRPFVALFTIFLPLWSLSLYSLIMYYQDITNYSMRIANGMVIVLSVFAYVPTIRDQLPSTPNLLFAEILIYLIVFTFILNLIQGYIVSNNDPETYSMSWNTDLFFLTALTINIITVAFVIILAFLFKFKWENIYDQKLPNTDPKFNRNEWRNEDCDRYFSQYPQVEVLKRRENAQT